MQLPSSDVMANATRDAARAVGRSIPFNREATAAYLQRLAQDAEGCTDLQQLLAVAIRSAAEARPSGPDLLHNVLVAAVATSAANNLPPTMSQQHALVDLRPDAGKDEYLSACVRVVSQWADTACPDSATPPTNAVILTARTGHPRQRLQDLDSLSEAVAGVMRSKNVTVQELALGEMNLRPAVDVDTGDRAAIDDADLVVAALQPPSVGVGISLGYACRHAPVIVLLNERGAPVPPLGIGMPWDTEVVEFEQGNADEAAEGVGEVAQRRAAGIFDCRDRRLARPTRWAATGGGHADTSYLPDWFPSRRLEELRANPGRVATASAEELDALCCVLGIPWRALSPDTRDLEISEAELKTVLRAADTLRWTPKIVEKIVFSVNDARAASLGKPMADRADIILEEVTDVVLYAHHHGIVERDQR